MLIYLDTMLWDILHDQKVSPDKLKKVLGSAACEHRSGPPRLLRNAQDLPIPG